jgi:hypothetical protein
MTISRLLAATMIAGQPTPGKRPQPSPNGGSARAGGSASAATRPASPGASPGERR